MRTTLTASLVCLCAALGTQGDAWGQKVGTAGAVNPASTGTPPGGGARTLKIGGDVVYRERIRTTQSGSLQVLFVDTTTLSIGPNSDMTIDQFVYDPQAGTGQFVASLAQGTLRFVGGKISHTAGATIKTPVATMGIRGGITFIAVNPEKLEVICGAGACSVDPVAPGADTVTVPQSGGLEVGADGAATPFTPTSTGVQAFTASITQGTANQNTEETNTSAGITQGGESTASDSATDSDAGQVQTGSPDTGVIVPEEPDDIVQQAEPTPGEPRGDNEEPPPPPEP